MTLSNILGSTHMTQPNDTVSYWDTVNYVGVDVNFLSKSFLASTSYIPAWFHDLVVVVALNVRVVIVPWPWTCTKVRLSYSTPGQLAPIKYMGRVDYFTIWKFQWANF